MKNLYILLFLCISFISNVVADNEARKTFNLN